MHAHARLLPAIEAVLSEESSLPPWRSSAAMLAADIDSLGGQAPEPMVMRAALGEAKQFGLLYVIEGSRLGTRLLARRVRQGIPALYLSAAHAPGEWGAFTLALDERARAEDPAWLSLMIDGSLKWTFRKGSGKARIFRLDWDDPQSSAQAPPLGTGFGSKLLSAHIERKWNGVVTYADASHFGISLEIPIAL